jgi:hypothetical protein
MRIDHVIYLTADLDTAGARIAKELGLTPVAGGRPAVCAIAIGARELRTQPKAIR